GGRRGVGELTLTGTGKLAQQLADEVDRARNEHRAAVLESPAARLRQRARWPRLADGRLEAELACERLQRSRRERAAARRSREPGALAQRQQGGEHARGVVVLEHAEHDREWPLGG